MKPRQHTYIMESSRSAGQMVADYPYDISLINTRGDTVLSTEVFPSVDKPIVLLFWLTTCYPCRMELEAIRKNWTAWQQEQSFHLLAISTDFPKNMDAFVQRSTDGWHWPAYNDFRREFSRIMPGGLNGLPQTFVLNKAGEIVYHKRRFRPGDEIELFDAIKKAAVD